MPNSGPFAHPTFFDCRQSLNRLYCFRDLILYYCPYAGFSERASKPLSVYVDENLNGYELRKKIEESISNLVELVGRNLKRAGVSTTIIEKTQDGKETQDIILNIFTYLREDRGTARRYDTLLDIVNRGIGIYEAGKKREGRRLLNPLYWISYLLRIPVIILQGADLVSDTEAKKTFFKIYSRVVQALMLLILYLIAEKLGAKILITSIFGRF